MNFDAVARHYQRLEHLAFGSHLERCRTQLLPQLDPPPRNALLIGEGDGRFLEQLTKAYPDAKVDVIEASGRMIELAQRRSNGPRVSFRRGDILQQNLDSARYDLIVTHFFLDVLTETELESLVERICRAAVPGANWLISEFQICGHAPWARYASRACIALMYAFFRLTSGLEVSNLPEYEGIFTRAGMHRHSQVTSLGGFLTSELWRLP